MMCSWNCFPLKQLWQNNAEENTLSLQHRNTHRLFNCISWIVFICKCRQMWCLWKENTSGDGFISQSVWTLKCLFVEILSSITRFKAALPCNCFWTSTLKYQVSHIRAKTIIIICVARQNSRYRQRSPVYSAIQRHTGWFPWVTSHVPPFKQ